MILWEEAGVWQLRVRLGASAEQQKRTSLDTADFEEAIFKAERIYGDMKRKDGDKPMCWQCIHWEPKQARCSFGWPEARQTGGRFAAQCSVFKACPTRQ